MVLALQAQTPTFRVNTINLTNIKLISPIPRSGTKIVFLKDSILSFIVKADCEAPLQVSDFTILLNNKIIQPQTAGCSANQYSATLVLPSQEQQLSFSIQVKKGNALNRTEPVLLTREIVAAVPSQIQIPLTSAFKPLSTVKKGKRLAFVVGNGDYTYLSNLQGKPQQDAKLIESALKSLDFQVISFTDLTRTAFEKSLKEFVNKAKGAEAIVIYYAGHGSESNGINYLLPTDARLDEWDDAEFQGISLDRVLLKMGEVGSKFSLALLDACRNNPFVNRTSRGDDDFRGFKPATVKASNQLILYATQTGHLATNDGLFANAIQEHLQPGVELMQFVKSITRFVKVKSKDRQIPAQYGSISEDFVF